MLLLRCSSVFLLIVLCSSFIFVFNDTATTEIYTLSLHDALPICKRAVARYSAVAGIAHHDDGARQRLQALQAEREMPCDVGEVTRRDVHGIELHRYAVGVDLEADPGDRARVLGAHVDGVIHFDA